jgi:hypothetical protein
MERTKVEPAAQAEKETVKPADDALRTLEGSELALVGGAGDDQPSWKPM